MASLEKEEKLSLVLTLFKGENFVCKKTHGFRCQIEAKCCDQLLSSGVFQISSTNSEPSFNFQLAWQFTRRQLRELRGNKVAVKVRCMLLSDDGRSSTELGYAVLHVKDAFPWSGGDVEASKARSYPLLGTREQWKTYHPKLLMQLHIEDYSVENLLANYTVQTKAINEISSPLNNNNNKPKSPKAAAAVQERTRFQNIDEVDKTPRVDVIPEMVDSVEKFNWRISEQDGCFQLGQPVDGDDLYVFNTTIVSVSNLHLLWNGRSPKKPASDDYVWQIRYKAYGCEIKSDPFILSQADHTRRTFIGDKATARIRAGSLEFYDYLQETAVEFHVVRFLLSPSQDLTDEEVMGMGFADLKDLAQSDVTELRATLDVVSEWGYPNSIIPSEKPEIRAVFQLDATAEFFKKTIKTELEESPSSPSTPIRNNRNDINDNQTTTDSPDGGEGHPPLVYEPPSAAAAAAEEHTLPDDSIDHVLKEIYHIDRETQNEAHHHKVFLETSKSEQESDSSNQPPPGPNSRSKHYSEDDVRDFFNNKRIKHKKEKSRNVGKENKKDADIEDSQSSKISDHQEEEEEQDTSEGFSFPKKLQEDRRPHILDIQSSSSSSNSSSFESSTKENSQAIYPDPGSYIITITLLKIWMKTKTSFTNNDIVVSYIHPKFRINEPVTYIATMSNEVHGRGKLDYKCLDINDGVLTIEVSFDRFNEKIVNEPLTVELRLQTKQTLEPMFAFSMIPIGSIIVQPGNKRGRRMIQGNADVQRIGTNLRVGILKYHIDFVPTTPYRSPKSKESAKLKESNKINLSPLKNTVKRDNVYVPSDIVFQTTDDLRLWQAEKKEEFDRELKEKERAYLKILAQEAAARDTQREKLMTEKLTGLTKKEKELRKLSSGIADREEQIKKKELELMELNQRVNLDNNATLENAKLSVRKMQEEHKIEISSLRRRNQEYEAELKKCKGKLGILEIKLEEKEDYINKLKTERHDRPESKLSEKLKLAEQENKILKQQIVEMERSREQYKRQSQSLCTKLAKLQEDRDRQLKEENENLRIQIMASKQHKEMKKGRKEGVDILQQIRNIQEESKSPRGDVGGGGGGGSSRGASGRKLDKTNECKQQKDDPMMVAGTDQNKKKASPSNEEEIQRLTTMRSGLLNTGAYTKYDMVIKEMERRIVGLAEGKIAK